MKISHDMKGDILLKHTYTLILGLLIACCMEIYTIQASEKHEHEEKHDHDKRQLESHEHGVSTLKIALENQILEMELEAPANDIVGFEHAPENKSEKAAIAQALLILKSKPGIFKFSSAANCNIKDVSGEFEVEKNHAGFHIIWKIKCLNPERIKNLETAFFQKFPKANEIEVEIVSNSGQSAIEWEKESNTIKLPNL